MYCSISKTSWQSVRGNIGTDNLQGTGRLIPCKVLPALQKTSQCPGCGLTVPYMERSTYYTFYCREKLKTASNTADICK